VGLGCTEALLLLVALLELLVGAVVVGGGASVSCRVMALRLCAPLLLLTGSCCTASQAWQKNASTSLLSALQLAHTSVAMLESHRSHSTNNPEFFGATGVVLATSEPTKDAKSFPAFAARFFAKNAESTFCAWLKLGSSFSASDTEGAGAEELELELEALGVGGGTSFTSGRWLALGRSSFGAANEALASARAAAVGARRGNMSSRKDPEATGLGGSTNGDDDGGGARLIANVLLVVVVRIGEEIAVGTTTDTAGRALGAEAKGENTGEEVAGGMEAAACAAGAALALSTGGGSCSCSFATASRLWWLLLAGWWNCASHPSSTQ